MSIDPLRICFVSQQYPPAIGGGIGRFTADLAQGFAEAGHDVHVMSAQGHAPTVTIEDGVQVHRFPVAPFAVDELLHEAAYFELLRIGSVYREVLTAHRERPFDIVSSPIWCAEGLLVAMDPRFVSILTLHTSTKTLLAVDASARQARESVPRAELETRCVQIHRHTHANSAASLATITREYGHVKGSFVIHHGVRDRAPQFIRGRKDDERIRILVTGRLEIRKGADLLLVVMPELLSRFSNVEFVLVGMAMPIVELEGKTLPSVFGETVSAESDWSRRVIFAGAVSDQDLYQSYSDADIFLFPSRYESFGLPVIEAMSFGLPVVACKAGGICEIVEHGENGLLVDVEDSRGLVEALSDLIADAAKRRRYGAASRARYLSHFTTALSVSRTISAYKAIAANENASHAAPDSGKSLIERFAQTIEDVTACRGTAAISAARKLATLPADLVDRTSRYFWFHSIDLGRGVMTKGTKPQSMLAAEANAVFDKVEMAGRNVLDVGAWNGFFSFEARRRGASRVLAVDSFCWTSPELRGRETFDLARESLGIDVEAQEIDISELDPKRIGQFDVVLFLGVFYHRYDPIEALTKVAALAKHVLILETHLDLQDIDRPAMVFYPGRELANDPTNWWGPNKRCIQELLRGHGFIKIDISAHPLLHDRGIFHAWRSTDLMRTPVSETAAAPPAAPVKRVLSIRQKIIRELRRPFRRKR